MMHRRFEVQSIARRAVDDPGSVTQEETRLMALHTYWLASDLTMPGFPLPRRQVYYSGRVPMPSGAPEPDRAA